LSANQKTAKRRYRDLDRAVQAKLCSAGPKPGHLARIDLSGEWALKKELAMKKTYEKPRLEKREKLSSVTAATAVSTVEEN
jgi:hypothetical protein